MWIKKNKLIDPVGAQIEEACYVDIHANNAVLDSLRNNSRDRSRFSYKARHDVKDKSQLPFLVFKYTDEITCNSWKLQLQQTSSG